MERRSWLLLFVLAASWGASFMLITIGLRELSPGLIAWSRAFFAALVLLPVAASQGALRGLAARWRALVVLGVVGVTVPFLFVPIAQQEVPSAFAAILVAAAPLYTAVLATWIDHEERAHGLRLLGLLIGFVGVVVLLGLDLSGSAAMLLGGLVILLSTVGYAAGGFIFKHRLSGAPPIGVAAAVMVVATIVLTPLAVATAPEELPSAGPVGALVALGVLGTGVAFAIFYSLIERIGPARAVTVSYLVPGFAVVYGAALLDEEITATALIGLALILVGSWLTVEGRLPGVARPSEPEPPEIDAAAGGMAPAQAAARDSA